MLTSLSCTVLASCVWALIMTQMSPAPSNWAQPCLSTISTVLLISLRPWTKNYFISICPFSSKLKFLVWWNAHRKTQIGHFLIASLSPRIPQILNCFDSGTFYFAPIAQWFADYIARLFIVINSSVNFFIYSISGSEFRKGLVSMVFCGVSVTPDQQSISMQRLTSGKPS